MRGTAAATTHMVDVPPDIHPNALGYDILTGALPTPSTVTGERLGNLTGLPEHPIAETTTMGATMKRTAIALFASRC